MIDRLPSSRSQHALACSAPAIALAVAFIVSILPTPQPAAAQDVEMTGELPDSIVVTANRYPEHVNLSGRRVSIWSADDIDRLPVAGFDELLRTVAGVEVFSRGGFGMQSDLSIRGSTFNGVLVLLDGLRLNDPMTGHFLMDLPIPMSEIARIEVVRGPAAAVYGPDAIGGVVQIFTHANLQTLEGAHSAPNNGDAGSAVGRRASGRHLDVEVAARTGEYGMYGAEAAVRPRSAGRHLSIAGALVRADGPQIIDPQGQPVANRLGAVRSDFRRNVQTAAIAASVGGRRITARVGRDDRAFGAYHYYTPFASDTAREKTNTLWLQTGIAGGRGATGWQIQGGLKQHDDRYVYNPITPANEHRSRLGQVHGLAVHDVSPRVKMTAGAGATWRSIDSNNLGRHDDGAVGVFYSIRWQPQQSLSLSGSARFDYDEGFGTAITPQVSAVWHAGSFGLHAVAGRSVRAPNFIERYFNTTLARPRGQNVGNPDLRPENAWSYEAGASAYPLRGVAMHATGFLRFTGDLIDYARLTQADTVFLARNLHDVRTAGLELDVSMQRRIGALRLRTDAAFTVLDADLGDVDPDVEYKYALTNARHVAQWALTASLGNAFGGLQALYRDPLDGEAYTVAHLRSGYAVPFGRAGSLQISVEARNILNRQYSEVFDAPAPPRWWLFSVRYEH